MQQPKKDIFKSMRKPHCENFWQLVFELPVKEVMYCVWNLYLFRLAGRV